MKGFRVRFLSLLIILTLIIVTSASIMPGMVSTAEAAPQADLFAAEQWVQLEPSTVIDSVDFTEFFFDHDDGIDLENNGIVLPVNAEITFTFDVPRTGNYNLLLKYCIKEDKVLKNTVTISWDNGEVLAFVPALWKDSKEEYDKDRYGNEIIPEQVMLEHMHYEFVKEYAGFDRAPYTFQLEKGQQTFTLTNNTQPLLLNRIYLIEEKNNPSYQQYREGLVDDTEGDGLIIIEAENYIAKSDSFIRPVNVQNPALYPYETYKKLLNVIEGTSWKEPGQKILWEFEVKTPGLYKIGFRYNQGWKEGIPVFRNIEIDGYTPFLEMRSYPFPYTGLNYSNLILEDSNGKPIEIWLDEGRHTIALEVDAAPVEAIIEELKKIMLEINDTGIDIKKLTGSSKDSKRTWDIKQYMPDIVERLEGWADRINGIYQQIESISGDDPGYVVSLKVAERNLRSLTKEPRKIPYRLTKLSEGSGSAAQLLGELILGLAEQPLSLDRIYLFAGEELPSAKAGLMERLRESFKSFIFTFVPQRDGYSVADINDTEGLTVWVNRPVQFVETLQQLADSDFTPRYGIPVKLSVMPDEQKLILANASRTNPDVALGISNHIPYELAIRGALLDLTQFEDFFTYISREYNLETLIPYYIEGGIYGVTETQDFYVLMYRKDILEKLNLPVPDTWEDVKNMMPELQRHSMNFYIPMAGWTGLKPFYTTAPFIFQCNGSIYQPDGLGVALNSEQTIKGFELMTELFSIYSLAENVPNFYNNFRYGITPIGVSNFGTYVMLMNAAPEIANLWDIALSPGVKDENGVIQRYQVASDRAAVIFANSHKLDESWQFMKWWLSKDTQIEYAYTMQTRFGPEYMWNTANMAAFEELPFPENHKKVILEQWKWMKEVPRHPAGYMVEREISNAWTNVVMNGENLRIAVDKAVLASNREIARKLEEFGYIKDGKVIREYHIPTVEDIKKRVIFEQ